MELSTRRRARRGPRRGRRRLGGPAEDMNWRLDHPPALDVSISRHMGLYAVSHLAARHGIRVKLRPGTPQGLSALVWLPGTLARRERMPAGGTHSRPLEHRPAADRCQRRQSALGGPGLARSSAGRHRSSLVVGQRRAAGAAAGARQPRRPGRRRCGSPPSARPSGGGQAEPPTGGRLRAGQVAGPAPTAATPPAAPATTPARPPGTGPRRAGRRRRPVGPGADRRRPAAADAADERAARLRRTLASACPRRPRAPARLNRRRRETAPTSGAAVPALAAPTSGPPCRRAARAR